MQKKLYVGNLPYSVTEAELKELFTQAGEVEEVTLINDRETGRAKGFGFVTMATEEGAAAAIEQFNGYMLMERAMVVNEARPREERPSNGGFRRSGGFNGGQRSGGYRGGNSYGGGRDGGNRGPRNFGPRQDAEELAA